MLKRVAVLALLAPLTLGNLSRPVEAAGWGPLVALLLASHLPISPEAGWRRGGGFHRAPYDPRLFGGYRDGGFDRAPYYPRYSRAYYGGFTRGGGVRNQQMEDTMPTPHTSPQHHFRVPFLITKRTP